MQADTGDSACYVITHSLLTPRPGAQPGGRRVYTAYYSADRVNGSASVNNTLIVEERPVRTVPVTCSKRWKPATMQKRPLALLTVFITNHQRDANVKEKSLCK